MSKQKYTENYLINQIDRLRIWSFNLAGLYLLISLFLDYIRFPNESLTEIYTARFIYMVLPIIIILLIFHRKDKFNLSQSMVEYASLAVVVLVGIGHAEILEIAEKYDLFFPKIGITIILIYAGLLLALPIKAAIIGSLTIIFYSSYIYLQIGIELRNVLSYFVFYCMYSTCCILTYVVCIKILKSNQKLLKKTHKQSLTDDLTGLYNRRYFRKKSAKILKQSIREEKPMAIILVDLDNFKKVNEILGQNYGDYILKQIANVMTLMCRNPSDSAYRIGGDEFALIIYDSNLDHIETVCNKIINGVKKLSKELTKIDSSLDVGVSVGVSENQKGEDYPIDLLFDVADKSLFEVKEAGKNNFIISDKSKYNLFYSDSVDGIGTNLQ